VLGLALALWPIISRWSGERVNAAMVYVAEQWLKIRGRWSYGFVVLDVPTELPGLAALRPSRGPWACRRVGRQLRQLTQVPQVFITDGLRAYAYLLPGATHVLCRVHHQPGVTHG
jgi:transposase-like protein